MITNRKQLKEYLNVERDIYLPAGNGLELYITSENNAKIFRYLCWLRKTEYYHNQKNFIGKLFYVYCRRKKNILGRRLGIEIWDNTFDKGLKIYHCGNIVVNGMAKIGKNCALHGSNCIGNNGKTLAAPQLGDNVTLGVGAKIIGGVTIASGITIAAGSVVIHDVLEEGVTVAGIPGIVVKRPLNS